MCNLKAGLTVHKDNELIYDMPLEPSHSFTRNAYNTWLQMFGYTAIGSSFAAGQMRLKGTDGIEINNDNAPDLSTSNNGGNNDGQMSGFSGSQNKGIVIGSSNSAESFEGYKLASQIDHGSGSGEMLYDQHETITPVYNSSTKVWSVLRQRPFNNNSSGDVIVNEIGLYETLTNNGWIIMYARDILTSTITVPNGGLLTVKYQTSFQMPE